jgi:hypothetical protein
VAALPQPLGHVPAHSPQAHYSKLHTSSSLTRAPRRPRSFSAA